MNYFVFVVCGGREHIDTLNFSLKFIRRFSKFEILVVTDSKRNEVPVVHDRVIDITTPEDYNHHEASIYLKTGLYKWVPDIENDTYCYLDSDIVALNERCDDIFKYKPDPIIFAKDHCPFEEFSPHAINCDCLERIVSKNNNFPLIKEQINKHFPIKLEDDGTYSNPDKIKLDKIFSDLKSNAFKHFYRILRYLVFRYVIPLNKFKFSDYFFNRNDRCWYNSSGEIIDFDFSYYEKKLRTKIGVGFDKSIPGWVYKNGENITPEIPHCNHLSEHLKGKFNIDIPAGWRHWNGGVFVFNKDSIEFLDYWHKISLDEFADNYSKTRDQGTLAATVWKFELENNPVISSEFNWIAEYDNNNISWKESFGYTTDNFGSEFSPKLIHIYHHWGDTEWPVWQSVLKLSDSVLDK